ncbi:MAG TPA: cation:proton antiporter [Candidatus Thermoplasmatota archaeon]|nr:cation:proton antiporter [Candidatus Thermoplasmatota archaeon]
MLGPAAEAFLLIGAAILAGLLGHAVFRRARVSDILVLLAIGFLLGPAFHLLDPSWLKPAMPILAPIGLVIILFEGGLGLRWDDLKTHGGGAVAFSVLSWGAGAIALWFAGVRVLGLAPHLALLFAVAVCATGIVAVIPILAQIRAPTKARVWLTIETGLGDLLSAVAVTGLAALYLTGGSPLRFGLDFGLRFLLGAAIGFLAGLAVARALHHMRQRANAYPLTLGGLLLAYAATEALGGSGFLSALIFGVVVGNAGALMKQGGVPALASISDDSRQHQGELIFLLRSIYFVYLGMSVGGALVSWAGALTALLLAAALLAARMLVVTATHHGDGQTRLLLTGMYPRGMATAVLASIPAAMGVPGSETFLASALVLIVGCDVATTIGIFLYERRRVRATAAAIEPVAG